MFYSLLLILTAFIWGIAFVAQKTGMENLGPLAFNGIRSIIGGLALLPLIAVLESRKSPGQRMAERANRRTLLWGGLCCGMVLTLASTLQQAGIQYTTVAKAGFITACYIIFVPLIGIAMKKRTGWLLSVAVVLTVIGLYLLCITDGFALDIGDLCVLICAVLFSLHILTVDYFAPKVNCVKLACLQFFVTGLLCLGAMPFVEGIPDWSAIRASMPPILYAGVMSSGVGYTLQIVAQKHVNPTLASILMSLESSFAVLGGCLLLNETLTSRQAMGCSIMFVAIILAQLPADITAKTKTFFNRRKAT